MSRRLMFLLVAGCAPKLVPCDPLASDEQVIALEEILGAGRAAGATVYVVDKVADGGRLFVSEGDALFRWRIDGSGEGSSDGIDWYVYSASLDEARISVGVQVEEGITTMAMAEGEHEGFDELMSAGELLSPVAEAEVLSMELHNLPGDVEIEYYARAGDASLLVLRPSDDWDYDDFRVFFGEGLEMPEREVDEVTRMRDGGSTVIQFETDDGTYEASFPIVSEGKDFSHGQATLDTGSSLIDMDWLEIDAATAGAAFTFSCLE